MRKLIWASLALLDFEDLQNYIGLDNPGAAHRVTRRIVEAIATLRGYPLLGRLLSNTNLRAFMVSGTPYMIVYRVSEEAVSIARIWHTRRDLKV